MLEGDNAQIDNSTSVNRDHLLQYIVNFNPLD